MLKLSRRISKEVIVRVVADVAMLNGALLVAFVIRFLVFVALGKSTSGELTKMFWNSLETYALTGWLFTLLNLVIFWLGGFYTHGRVYRGRYKMLVIIQAVSLAYVIFGFLTYFVRPLVPFPRSVLGVAWPLTIGLLVGSRMWARIWRRVIKAEDRIFREVERDDTIRNVLVIGGAGYIGSVLCRQLLEKGYQVRVLDALLYGQESLSDLADNPRFELMEGDSRDVSAVFRAVLDMDAVVHLGELVGDPACALDEKLTLEINLAATRMVAEAAKGYGIKRFAYASSCSVYGASQEILNEKSRLKPVSLYARAKIGSEQALLALDGPDFHPVILRFATVYGLSPRPRFDLVINILTAKAVRDGEITIFGGEQWRPFVHVADVAEAIVRCLEAPLDSVKGQVFNVGSDEQNYTITQVGELIHGLIPEAQLVNRGGDVDRRDYHVSFAKIQRELNFEPHHTVEDGVREIEAALRKGRIEDYRENRYSNYKTLSDPANHLSIRSRHITELYAPRPAIEREDGAVVARVSLV